MSGNEDNWFPVLTGALLAQKKWSTKTRLAYYYGIKSWHEFSREIQETCRMPPRPTAVVGWLQWQVEQGYSRRTIGVHLTALSWASAWSTSSENSNILLIDDPLIRAWRRVHRRPSRAVKRDAVAPTLDEIGELVQACYVQRQRAGKRRNAVIAARDRAMILLTYYGALRKSEISKLTFGDVVVLKRGLELTFGSGETLILWPQEDVRLCPVDAWRRWINVYASAYASALPSACAFSSVDPSGAISGRPISYHSIRKIFENRCRDAGIRNLNPDLMRIGKQLCTET